MSDYEVTLTVKNNKLLSVMKLHGFHNAAMLSRATGVGQGTIGDYLNLKETMLNRHGKLRTPVIKLAEFFQALPEDLFPEEQFEGKLEKNRARIEVDFVGVQQLLGADVQPALEETVSAVKEGQDFATRFGQGFKNLCAADRDALNLRYGLDGSEPMTLSEISKIRDVTPERVRQRIKKAMRRLKYSPHELDRLTEGYEYDHDYDQDAARSAVVPPNIAGGRWGWNARFMGQTRSGEQCNELDAKSSARLALAKLVREFRKPLTPDEV